MTRKAIGFLPHALTGCDAAMAVFTGGSRLTRRRNAREINVNPARAAEFHGLGQVSFTGVN